jgi:GWxTD domain-containing protein
LPNNITSTLCCLFVLCHSFLGAQSGETPGFDLHLDCARFKAEQGMTFVEIYYAFSRDSVSHVPRGNHFEASYRMTLDILMADSVIKTLEWKREDVIQPKSEIKPNQMISDVYPILLANGNFKVRLEINDLAEPNRAVNEIGFQIDSQSSDSLWMSDIQVAIGINRSEEQNRLVKNGWSVVPNPSTIFNLNWPVLYYYCEIYNLKLPDSDVPEGQDRYNVISTIRDINGQVIKKIPAKSKKITDRSVVEINKTVVSSLVSGAYNLQIEIVNLATGEKTQKSKPFYMYRMADFAQTESGQAEKKDNLYLMFLTRTEEELDREFEYMSYMANSDEEDIYEELNLDGKRKFLASFWGVKNVVEGENAQGFRRNYLNLINMANDRFSSGGKEGWQTHRGRVLITYGEPDDIERNYGGGASKEHEKWTYNLLQGGIFFIFVDASGYGDFRLVHSNAREEVYDRNWQQTYLK